MFHLIVQDAASEKARLAKERRRDKSKARGEDRLRGEGEDKADDRKAAKAEEELQALKAARQVGAYGI